MITFAVLQKYLLEKDNVSEEIPFGVDTKVFKVFGKMFALVAWQEVPLRITLKCDPDDALALRAKFSAIQPGYYMNKIHWNTLTLDGSIPEDDVYAMIDDSYSLVLHKISKRFKS